jgi:hypothetical protein
MTKKKKKKKKKGILCLKGKDRTLEIERARKH